MPWSQRYHWNLILYLSQQHCVLSPCFMVNGSLPTADTVMLSKSAKLGDIVVSFSLTCAFFLISCGHLCEDETWCVSGSYTPLYTWQWLCGGCHGYTSGGSLGRAAVLHLLPETLVSNFLFIFFILLQHRWYLAGKMQRKKKQMWQFCIHFWPFKSLSLFWCCDSCSPWWSYGISTFSLTAE